MSTSRPDEPAAHVTHDRIAIAAFAAGDLTGRERAGAAALVEACTSCRVLFDDLLAIRAAVRTVPPARRPTERSFELTGADVQRLARGARWRALLRPFGASRGFVIRHLAGAFVTLGLIAVILSAQPLLDLGTGTAVPSRAVLAAAPPRAVSTATPAPTPAPTLEAISGTPVFGAIDAAGGPSAAPGGESGGLAAVPQGDAAKQAPDVAATPDTPTPQILLPVIGAVLIAAGLVLLLLHRLAIRAR